MCEKTTLLIYEPIILSAKIQLSVYMDEKFIIFVATTGRHNSTSINAHLAGATSHDPRKNTMDYLPWLNMWIEA
jgi:hypothetical protein